ncbi:winged helix-turn-helix transcriptional regulator [Paraclostridium bifermentans]|nr:winged helix-turn-helix transcriptional regulator [Paraclostridium bifermentans]
MLTKCLKELEADGIILRHDFKTIPPSVKYKLTKSEKTYFQLLMNCINGEKNKNGISRKNYKHFPKNIFKDY